MDAHDCGRLRALRRRSLVIEALEKIALDIITSISLNKLPMVHVPNRRDWENTTFCQLNGVGMNSQVKTTSCISMHSLPAARDFAVFIDILSKIFVLLKTGSESTKREIYYKNVDLYGSQSAVDYVIDSLAALLRVPRFWLNVVASSKGFVSGPLQFVDAHGHCIDCSAKAGGTLLPANIADITDFRTNARWALIVEKDATFQALLDARLPHSLGPCLFITGKGFPDVNTRHFIKRLWQELNIPLFALVDADPHGNYGNGSLDYSIFITIAFILCLHLTTAQSALMPLSKTDQRKAQSLLQRPYISQNPQLQQEVTAMLSSGTKGEIECLSTHFLCQTYLPEKIRNGCWL